MASPEIKATARVPGVIPTLEADGSGGCFAIALVGAWFFFETLGAVVYLTAPGKPAKSFVELSTALALPFALFALPLVWWVFTIRRTFAIGNVLSALIHDNRKGAWGLRVIVVEYTVDDRQRKFRSTTRDNAISRAMEPGTRVNVVVNPRAPSRAFICRLFQPETQSVQPEPLTSRPEREISIEYTLTAKDVASQSMAVLRHSGAFQVVLNIFLLLLWFLSFAILNAATRHPELSLIASCLGILVFYGLFIALSRAFVVKLVSKKPDLGTARFFVANSEGMIERTPVGRVELRWSAVDRVIFNPKFLLLRIAGSDGFYFPRRAFSSEAEFLTAYRSLAALHAASRSAP